ncbi:MAG TPA: hypothetical protein VG939_16295 [Caulobacteraceae bacterium]|nr:hypothetical protein [Caulobacteraceae bacterium]
MRDVVLDDLTAILPPLLQSLDALGFVSRYLHPPDFAAVLEAAGAPDAALAETLTRMDAWPAELGGLREILTGVADEASAAFAELRGGGGDDMRTAYRALRHLPRAMEGLYPLAAGLPPVSRFFLEPGRRDDAALMARLRDAPPREDVGVFHLDNDPGSRGGFSLYVPEDYAENRPAPLVMALHGGAGNGRGFLWSWIREARSRGAILVAPTALGDTWALTGRDVDTPNLERILGIVRGRWAVDPSRLLLTGMSDGGTFSYVSGLEPTSAFTHLAPISAAFHPILAQMADPDRLAGLPIHIVHGALDWMFPIDMAREAQAALAAAGAAVTYVEIDDLSHTYPREANAAILDWLGAP